MIQGEPGKPTLGVGAGDEIHTQKANDKNEKRDAYRSKHPSVPLIDQLFHSWSGVRHFD